MVSVRTLAVTLPRTRAETPRVVRRHRDKVAACFGGGAHDCPVRLVVFGVNDRVHYISSLRDSVRCGQRLLCPLLHVPPVFGRRVLDLLGGQRKGVKRLRDRHERDLRPRLGGERDRVRNRFLRQRRAVGRNQNVSIHANLPFGRLPLGPRRQRLHRTRRAAGNCAASIVASAAVAGRRSRREDGRFLHATGSAVDSALFVRPTPEAAPEPGRINAP